MRRQRKASNATEKVQDSEFELHAIRPEMHPVPVGTKRHSVHAISLRINPPLPRPITKLQNFECTSISSPQHFAFPEQTPPLSNLPNPFPPCLCGGGVTGKLAGPSARDALARFGFAHHVSSSNFVTSRRLEVVRRANKVWGFARVLFAFVMASCCFGEGSGDASGRRERSGLCGCFGLVTDIQE